MSLARRSILPWIYGGSLIAHIAFGAVMAILPTPERSKEVAIELADIKKRKPPKPPTVKKPPPPKHQKAKPPPPPKPVAEETKVAQAAAKLQAPPPPQMGADGFANLEGVAIGGPAGEGVPIGGPGAAETATAPTHAAPKVVAHKVERLTASARTECSDPVVKPKMKRFVKPEYTKAAREAEIEGDVRIQVTVDETGRVIAARILSGLGYGLDELALAAAKQWLFEPATLCGKPIVATHTVAFDFELQ